MRTFIAIEIPAKIRREIDKLIKEETRKNLPIKWVSFENLHITLKFLGEIDNKKKYDVTAVMNDVVKKIKQFIVTLEGLGCFPSLKNPRVLWVGVTQGDKEMIEVANELENSLAHIGFKKEDKKFHPHLTIGRIKTFCKVDEILQKTIKTEPFSVDAVVLFKSTLKPEGPIYEELQKFPLITASPAGNNKFSK